MSGAWAGEPGAAPVRGDDHRVVVLGEAPVPGWVEQWCRRTGRRAQLVPVPDHPDRPPAP